MLLDTGEVLTQRLAEACPSACGNVFATGDLIGVKEKDQITPALHVVLFDYRPADQNAGDIVWREVWLVVAVVKNVSRKNRVSAQQDDAKPLLREALAALSGWRPARSISGALTVIPGPRPSFFETHAYFPLAFAASPKTVGVGEEA